MNGWYFIVMAAVLVVIASILGIYGQQLLSKKDATAIPAINVTGSGNTVTVGGLSLQALPPSAEPPSGQSRPAASGQAAIPAAGQTSALAENSSFEDGLEAWGSGFFESGFAIEGPLPLRAISSGGADATWRADGRHARTGSRAPYIEHRSQPGPHVFSMLSQRIKVKPYRTYRLGFWFFAGSGDPRGGLNLRFLPSRSVTGEEWDRRKIKAQKPKPGEWTPFSETFNTGGDTYFDVRFFAESPVTAWAEDVFVEEVPGS